MKIKISLINLLLVIGYSLVGFIVLAANGSEGINTVNGFNTMYIGLAFGLVLTLVTYFTTKDNLASLVNITGNFLILLVALILALADVNYLYALASVGGIAVIYAVALVSLSFRTKE